MKFFRWPWRHRPPVNGDRAEARRAKHEAEVAKVRQEQQWPEIWRKRDEFIRLVEEAMRGEH